MSPPSLLPNLKVDTNHLIALSTAPAGPSSNGKGQGRPASAFQWPQFSFLLLWPHLYDKLRSPLLLFFFEKINVAPRWRALYRKPDSLFLLVTASSLSAGEIEREDRENPNPNPRFILPILLFDPNPPLESVHRCELSTGPSPVD